MSLQYVIDGYNIINHPLFLRAHKHTEGPPEGLLSFIRAKKLTGSRNNKIIIVFDGYPRPSGVNSSGRNEIIVFSRRISADHKIKMIVEESANRKNIVVVSDDREIKFTVKSLGAQSLGVEGFIREKKSARGQDEDLDNPEITYSLKQKINQELRKIWLE